LTESTLIGAPGRLDRHRAWATVNLVVVEALDVLGDLVERILDGEMATVEHVQLGFREIAKVCASALGGEEDVVLAPEDQRFRPALPQERLPLRIELDVGAVVVEEIELHLARTGTLEEVQVHVPVVRADVRWVAVPVQVDELDALKLEERLERLLRLPAAIDPERVPNPIPGSGEALLIGVGVLYHLPLEPVGMTGDDAVADRPAVVLHVEPERVEAGLFEQALDDLREPVECVLEVLGHVGVAEAWIVRGEDVEAVGERRDQVAELVRGGGEAAEQQQLGIRRIAGLPVEDVESVDLGCLVEDHVAPFGCRRGG